MMQRRSGNPVLISWQADHVQAGRKQISPVLQPGWLQGRRWLLTRS